MVPVVAHEVIVAKHGINLCQDKEKEKNNDRKFLLLSYCLLLAFDIEVSIVGNNPDRMAKKSDFCVSPTNFRHDLSFYWWILAHESDGPDASETTQYIIRETVYVYFIKIHESSDTYMM